MRARFASLILLTALTPLHAGAQDPPRLASDFDPTMSDIVVAGQVVIESDGAAVVVAIDRAKPGSGADGLADHVASFQATEPLSPPLSYRGEALVDFVRRSLRVTPIAGEPGWTFSIDAPADAPEEEIGEARLVRGGALIYRSADLGRSLDQVLADARKERRAVWDFAVGPPVFDQDPFGGGTGCASSCWIACFGEGSACSISCSLPTCAYCSCQSDLQASCFCS